MVVNDGGGGGGGGGVGGGGAGGGGGGAAAAAAGSGGNGDFAVGVYLRLSVVLAHALYAGRLVLYTLHSPRPRALTTSYPLFRRHTHFSGNNGYIWIGESANAERAETAEQSEARGDADVAEKARVRFRLRKRLLLCIASICCGVGVCAAPT